MKKVLSLVLALVLVLGMIPTFAAGETGAELLFEHEFIVGDGTGNLMVEKVLTRAEMAVLFAQMYGKEVEAAAFVKPANFTDEATFGWAANFISFAQESGWVSGYPDGSYKPENVVTGKELLSAMLQVLGYEFTWETLVADAAAVGLTVSTEGPILRGAAFETMWIGVSAININGEEMTIGEKTGKIEPVVVVPEELEVVEVTANNLFQVFVEFNMNVEENEEVADVDNYELDVEDIDAVDVDGNMVTLTLVAAVAQQKMGELTISDAILDEEAVVEFQFLDTTMPEALSAEVVGEKTIKFTYSEPVKTPVKADFVIDGGNLFIDTIEMLNNNTEVNVTLYSTLEEGTLAVQTKNVEDFAGFSILSKTFQVEVVEDTEAPYVVSFKDAKPTEVTLVFNEEIKFVGSLDTSKYYHTNGNNEADDVTIDGNEMTIKFTEAYKMSPGSTYVYVLKEQVKDLWSNENAQVMFQVEVVLDVTAPAVKSTKVTSETTMEVVFTEDVESDSATDEDNYLILEDGEEEDYISSVAFATGSTTKVIITFTEKLAGDYVLVIENVEDLAGNEIAATSLAFVVEDMTAPEYTDFTVVGYKLGLEGQLIKVNFGEKMAVTGSYSVNDVDKYVIGSTALADLDGVTITVVDNGEAIEIRIPRTADLDAGETGLTVASGNTLYIARVADAAGNKTVALSGSRTITAASFVTYTVQQTGAKTFVMKFSEKLANFDAADFTVYSDVTAITAIASRSIAVVDNKTQVTYTLVNALDTNVAVSKLRVEVTAAAPETDSAYGQTVNPAADVVATDKAAPVLFATDAVRLATATTTKVILVEYTEDLKAVDPALLAQEFVVTMDGDVLVAGAAFDYTATIISGDTIQITINDTVEHINKVTVASKATITYITDAAGNKVKPIESKTLVTTP